MRCVEETQRRKDFLMVVLEFNDGWADYERERGGFACASSMMTMIVSVNQNLLEESTVVS